MTSGNILVDKVSKLRLNSIPEMWYRTIRKKDTPHAMAILVLWDLVYWYKWTEVREEESGLLIGYTKKFKADLLQRNYAQIGEKFGISKKVAGEVISFLEDLGVIRKELRTIVVQGQKIPHVMFIAIVPEVLEKLTNGDDMAYVDTQMGDNILPNGSSDIDRLGGTNTTITTTTSTTNISSATSEPALGLDFPTDDSIPSEPIADAQDKVKKTKKSTTGKYPMELYKRIIEHYNNNCKSLKLSVSDVNYKVLMGFWRKTLDKFTEEQIHTILDNGMRDSWVVNTAKYSLASMFAPSTSISLLNGNVSASTTKNNRTSIVDNMYRTDAMNTNEYSINEGEF